MRFDLDNLGDIITSCDVSEVFGLFWAADQYRYTAYGIIIPDESHWPPFSYF